MRFPVDVAGEGLYGICWGKKVSAQQIRRDRISEICDCRGEKLEALDNCSPFNGPVLRWIGIFDNSDCVRDFTVITTLHCCALPLFGLEALSWPRVCTRSVGRRDLYSTPLHCPRYQRNSSCFSPVGGGIPLPLLISALIVSII